ncbi:ly6/PLAUR domain-containing protein 8 isoform X1 [Fukomys damarensis]|uniref:ly6/PLAUR domain-containing protein 8 isoform X1 n=1 Tax=Fukomys damarensis TaxID=885580 RepID=UPI00053FC360|nr:ly6/PLAUR domain-containing protein 8 isoform X1 [Fukomys damarensis]
MKAQGCVTPHSREVGSSTMRGILTAVVTTALAIAAVESLRCKQCDSLNSCTVTRASKCPPHASTTCVSSLANSFLGREVRMQQEMLCSAASCSREMDSLLAFTVHVSDGEHFHFESQCCQGKTCGATSRALDSPLEDLSSTECPACHASDVTSCVEKPRKCYKEERCVYLIAQYHNATETLVLKGCSNIGISTCQLLSAGNQPTSVLTFQKVECTDALVATSNQATKSKMSSPTSSQATDFSTGSLTSSQATDFSTGSSTSSQATEFSTGSPTSSQATDFSTGSPTSSQATDFSTGSPTSSQATDFSTGSLTSSQATDFSTGSLTSIRPLTSAQAPPPPVRPLTSARAPPPPDRPLTPEQAP